MEAAAAIRNVLGSMAVVAALALASPGVRASQDEADFSYDPALEPTTVATAPIAAPGATCGAKKAPVLPGGVPLLLGQATPPGEGNSLNGRGYNIGPKHPLREIQVLNWESKRHDH